MTDHNTTVCVAIIALVIVELVALMEHIDGALLTGVVALIAALGGVKFQQLRALGMLPVLSQRRSRRKRAAASSSSLGPPRSGIAARRHRDSRGRFCRRAAKRIASVPSPK